MDQSARYMELVRRGRDEFLREAAGGAVVRPARALNSPTSPGQEPADSTLVVRLDIVMSRVAGEAAGIEVLALAKKAGAAFSDMITVGRTTNNDVVLNDVTVSRFHAYFKQSAGGGWIVCDAGSKNGTKLDGGKLDPRKEMPLASGAVIVFGEVPVTFYAAADLFDYLSGLAS